MNIMRRWGVENLAQSTELFAKQQVKHHSVIHLKDDMMFSGAVFAAKHVQCRRASEKTRLVEEVDILKSLDHPNIMKLYR